MTEIIIMDSFIDISDVFDSGIVTILERESEIITDIIDNSYISENMIYDTIII